MPIAPTPAKLLEDKGPVAEANLNIYTGLTLAGPSATTLYTWADAMLSHLASRQLPDAKLALATAMDLDQDPSFGAVKSKSASRPRHRIVARFLREGILSHVWSINWDCHLENALSQAGMDSERIDHGIPWKSGYKTVISALDLPGAAHAKLVTIYKPHGCIRAMQEACRMLALSKVPEARVLAERFLIGESELKTTVTSTGPASCIYAPLTTDINTRPLLVAGWSLSEQYLRDHLTTHCEAAKAAQTPSLDECSCVDLTYQPGHQFLSDLFRTLPVNTHIGVEKTDAGVSTDNLFRWIQALYFLDRLILAADPADRPQLENLLQQLEANKAADKAVLDWFDHFLPAWIRLCWRQSLLSYMHGGVTFDLAAIPMESPEESIPLDLSGRPWDDLIMAANILSHLIVNGHLSTYDYETCPGAFLEGTELTFCLPFSVGVDVNDLRNDAAMNRCWTNGVNHADALRLCLVPLDLSSAPTTEQMKQGKQLIADALALARFRNTSTYTVISAGDL